MVDVNDSDFEWPRTYIQIVPRLSGSLSAVSSATIIYLILRSQTRLSSIYHQIMLCMSMFDILANVGRVLAAIPMPREMPQEKELGFEWPGTRYGNHATCAAQGFFTLSGAVGMFAFNSTLCLCKYQYSREQGIGAGYYYFVTLFKLNFVTKVIILTFFSCVDH